MHVFHKALSVPNLLDKSSEKSIHSQISTQLTQPPSNNFETYIGPSFGKLWPRPFKKEAKIPEVIMNNFSIEQR